MSRFWPNSPGSPQWALELEGFSPYTHAFIRTARPVRAAVAVLSCVPNSGLPEGRLQKKRRSEMPKLKTKSGAKKRFKITGTGKVKYA